MKRIILTIILGINLLSCSSDEGSEAVTLDIGVAISLQNQEGIDLFQSPEYNPDTFQIFYVIDGENVEIDNPNLDYPRNFYMLGTSPETMRLFLNSELSEDNNSETLIKWNNAQSDLIKAHFRSGVENNEDYLICDKIWVNDVLAWDGNGSRTIIIIK